MKLITGGVCAAKGFTAGGIHCGIRKNHTKKDLAMVFSSVSASAAAVYTTNLVKGAPLTVTKEHLADGKARAVICNSGNANTCNADGIQIAEAMCAETAKVLTDIFSVCLGDDYVKLETKTYISSLANEVRKPRLASLFINGWGADFADPINFLGQETYNDTAAYYSTNYSYINDATDPDLIAAYQEFTDLVVAAKAITNDMDARYAAFAKAEACFIGHVFTIPCSYEVSWELTKINNYSKVYSMYGMQSYRYVDWETSTEPYTTEQMEANAAAYAAE